MSSKVVHRHVCKECGAEWNSFEECGGKCGRCGGEDIVSKKAMKDKEEE